MKIAVLGLGESLNLYLSEAPFKFDLTLGVNDIWRKVCADVVVCLDERDRFSDERLKFIDECRPQHFYSQLDCWAARPDFTRIQLQEQFPDYVCQLDISTVPKSLCSPFVAAAVAYKFHQATEVHLYGVDLINHPHLQAHSCTTIVKHFRSLKTALAMHGCGFVVHGSGLLKSL
jgi:hypothetical protein